MAMTKAEAARVAELETALALCWPPYPEPKAMTVAEIRNAPQIKTPSIAYGGSRKAVPGFFCNSYSGEISAGFSDGVCHSRHGSWSQTHGSMYSSKAEAAKALRHQMSRDFAKKLAAVDRIIREAE